jgi:hypothetical protein
MSLTLIVMVSFATPIQTRLSKVLTRPWRKRKAMNIVQITYVTTTRLSSLSLPYACRHLGRLHGEFVRLLYILAHRLAVRFFATLDYEPCDEELCQRRGAFFFQHCARIGLAGAQAAALRMGGNTRPPAGACSLANGRSSPLTPHFNCLPSPTTIFFLLPLHGFMALSSFLFLFCFCFSV